MSVVDMDYTLTLFEKTRESCSFIWTPLTDEQEEGLFMNALTGKAASYLPWMVSEPNGFLDENLVLLSIKGTPGYVDNVLTKKPSCTVCDIGITTTFNLIGVCEQTFFSKHLILFSIRCIYL